MKIQLQNNLWVFSDSRQYVLKRFNGINAKGEDQYSNIGFFTNLGNLAKAAIRTGVQGDDINSLQKLAERIEEIAIAFDIKEIVSGVPHIPDFKSLLRNPNDELIISSDFD